MKRYHQTKGMRCSKCNTLFYHPQQLKRHEDIQLCSKSKFCTECNTNFKTNNSLLKHSILVHGTDKPHKCFQCNKSFKLYTSLKLHDRSMHMRSNDVRTPCDICGKRILKREIKRHLKIHKNDREMIKCEQCDKKFLHQCSLKIHIQRFHENKPREYKHLCTICGKKFGTRCDLDRHGSVHRNDRPFECPQCGKGFKLNHNLKSHIKQIHMNMKKNNRIPCKVCGKMISKTNMKPHLQTHKAVRDIYNCTQCSKQFLHQLSLEQHIQKFHEKIVREFRHLCNMCGKGFNTRAELKIHMLSHSDEKTFACQTCNMKYKTMHGLRYHVKSVHLNLKPHPCPICSRHFSTRSVVERHMRTHTGERPFVCALCEKSFNQKSTLTTHMRLVHST
ncbi:zinc finger protein 235-like [Chrysoperla carnea]|uniref:zinc finger protein 235-like n=1 Tax=Chrysoperla carnea TaxID=189513 RepID=UPI001D0936EC|nr:zinc finger protein 235-like [Chrysoperla carnea]